jgi:hypothetical protein
MDLLAKSMHLNFLAFSIKRGECLASFVVTVNYTDYFIRQFFVKFFIPFAPATWYDILRFKHGHFTLTASFVLSVLWVQNLAERTGSLLLQPSKLATIK